MIENFGACIWTVQKKIYMLSVLVLARKDIASKLTCEHQDHLIIKILLRDVHRSFHYNKIIKWCTQGHFIITR